jgi:tetratricopeptide (TPR) repeat protein
MKNVFRLLVVFSIAMLGACTEGSKGVDSERAALVVTIDSLEQAFFGNEMNVDKELAAQLLQSYIKFTDTYPMDEHTADYLYKGAGLARGVRLYTRALQMYTRILTDYPDYKKIVETQFLIAFTYDNDIKDIEKAKEAYNLVIEMYPNHEFAVQARERLKTIDLSDEELIELFMQMNAETVQSN